MTIQPTNLELEYVDRGSAWAPNIDMYESDGTTTRDVSGSAYTFVYKVYDLSGTLVYSRSTAVSGEGAKDGTYAYRWHPIFSDTDTTAMTDDEYRIEIEETNTGVSPTGPYVVARGTVRMR